MQKFNIIIPVRDNKCNRQSHVSDQRNLIENIYKQSCDHFNRLSLMSMIENMPAILSTNLQSDLNFVIGPPGNGEFVIIIRAWLHCLQTNSSTLK